MLLLLFNVYFICVRTFFGVHLYAVLYVVGDGDGAVVVAVVVVRILNKLCIWCVCASAIRGSHTNLLCLNAQLDIKAERK